MTQSELTHSVAMARTDDRLRPTARHLFVRIPCRRFSPSTSKPDEQHGQTRQASPVLWVLLFASPRRTMLGAMPRAIPKCGERERRTGTAIGQRSPEPCIWLGKNADEGGAGTPGAPELRRGNPRLKFALPLATAKLRPPQATGGTSHPRRLRMLREAPAVKLKSTKYWGLRTDKPQSLVDPPSP